MSQIITRATSTDLSIRSDGRTVHGIAVPFNSPTDIRDFEGEYAEQLWQNYSAYYGPTCLHQRISPL